LHCQGPAALAIIKAMKRLLALMTLCLAAWTPAARAQTADNRYVEIYSVIQQADIFNSAGRLADAMRQYLEAQKDLREFHAAYPTWNEKVVNFRLNYVAAKIAQLSARTTAGGASTNAPTAGPGATAEAGATNAPAAAPANAELDQQIQGLRDQVQHLEAERVLLREKLKEALAVQPAAVDPRELAKTEEKNQSLEKENALLQVTVAELKAKAAPPITAAADQSRQALDDANQTIKQLTAQRDELQKNLQTATQQLKSRKSTKDTGDRLDSMNKELVELRAKVQVLEAQPAPYGPEELALLRRPDATPATVAAKPVLKPKKLPPGAEVLNSEAQRYFVAHDYAKAEAKYLEVLKTAPDNIVALGNAASIEVEMNHLDDAESHLKQALAQDPDDAYSLLTLGRLRAQQKRYDESFTALSHAAQVEPNNAEIQNYLGITLSEQGLRGPAESALRKALQLSPTYATAHNNLAVVYLTQKPPLIELARWHYQKALAYGQPHNEGMEKMLGLDKPDASKP
jgi:Flp pilus assembly protein TadD